VRSAFEPQVIVPGATPIFTENGVRDTDKRGRPLWTMPPPSSYVEHKRRRRHRRTGAVIKETITVPVYRGVAACDYRYARAQYRRLQRKMEARERDKKSMVVEAGDFLRDLVLNPAVQDKEGDDDGEE